MNHPNRGKPRTSHVVEWFSPPDARWFRSMVCHTGREASDHRRALTDYMRSIGIAEPKVRVRMGDPEVLFANMNETKR